MREGGREGEREEERGCRAHSKQFLTVLRGSQGLASYLQVLVEVDFCLHKHSHGIA